MATTYQYRLLDTEFGPVGFRELVRLVREGRLGTDDPVKADWEQEWHPAAEVVGLFHMAGRADVLEKWEAERQSRARAEGDSDLEELLNQAESAEGESLTDGQRRWLELQGQERALAAEKERERRRELAEARTQSSIHDTIAAAEAAFDQREAARRPGLIQQWKAALFSSSSLHRLFRWGMAFTAANLVAFGILTWTDTEAQRYPKRGTTAVRQQVFPFWGQCSTAEYLFLLADAMILAGLAGYGAARALESMADD